jgi:hypothetical protein
MFTIHISLFVATMKKFVKFLLSVRNCLTWIMIMVNKTMCCGCEAFIMSTEIVKMWKYFTSYSSTDGTKPYELKCSSSTWTFWVIKLFHLAHCKSSCCEKNMCIYPYVVTLSHPVIEKLPHLNILVWQFQWGMCVLSMYIKWAHI